ncbi:hypothetical protein F5B20DRAFT_593295 [Whalleya microplaca]|nr:hypothetical protein F5B20DRAFT_593295 [Whalleya microplaca]
MATFLEDPRLRQRWNRISQTTETVTENAAAGIWTFGHRYINPCLASAAAALDSCTTVCLGGREERARRARDRQRARGNAEFIFDFYDDWDEEFGESVGASGSGLGIGGGGGSAGGSGGGILGGWRSEDWDHLLAGTGKKRKAAPGGGGGEIIHEQPRAGRARGMSYGGTRGGARRKASGQEDDDPTIIPSTAPLGFLSRLPFKFGGPLRYKPSAANLQEHPGAASRHMLDGERVPLLGHDHDDGDGEEGLAPHEVPIQGGRRRSGTSGSGDTSDSFRSRGDLFPSDGEGDEDAIPLDDEFTISLDHVDDRSSNKTRSSKGKRIAGKVRSISRTTIDSTRPSLQRSLGSESVPPSPAVRSAQSLEDLQQEEEIIEREEDEVVEKRRQAAADLALQRGLSRENLAVESVREVKSEMVHVEEVPVPEEAVIEHAANDGHIEAGSGSTERESHPAPSNTTTSPERREDDFVPARLPYFR